MTQHFSDNSFKAEVESGKRPEPSADSMRSGISIETAEVQDIEVNPQTNELPENPEVGARLTNLSYRQTGTRPAWFDFEPLSLPSRSRQVRKLFWHIQTAHQNNQKQIIALIAPKGMGKTSFLSELYSMLEHSKNSALTLAPGSEGHCSYQALRNILEQRFYISGEATFEYIRQYVSSAAGSMLEGRDASETTQGLMQLWKIGKPEANHPISDESKYGIVKSLKKLLEADMKRNAYVIVFDDAKRFDEPSLDVLSELIHSLDKARMTILLTADSEDEIPQCFRERCQIEHFEIQAMSDSDLGILTRSLLKKLSEKREKLIVPRDMCNLIAQRAFGNPQRAIELTLRHFSPDRMVLWNEAMDTLRREPVPQDIAHHLLRRFKACQNPERIVLQFASQLNAPFTASTIESILSSWNAYQLPPGFECSKLLRELRDGGYLEHASGSFANTAPAYTFKHECERIFIAGSVKPEKQKHAFKTAAQWYALNNPEGTYDEVIGDLWCSYNFMHEACRYYEKAAYRALNHSQFQTAWELFRKLLKVVPEENTADIIRYSLDSARVAFCLGQVDDAFKLNRRACHHASRLSAYSQAARGYLQMATMLIEIGSIRHIRRYTSYANILLNREGDPNLKSRLFFILARRELFLSNLDKARYYLEKAKNTLPGDRPLERMLQAWTEAEIDAESGRVKSAVEQVKSLIKQTEASGNHLLGARLYRSLGIFYQGMDNISAALEAWNTALGMVQEMHDEILHAKLLADIADGAIRLEARKTARAATEQCLAKAQQTHQKLLISRCLANNAFLQFSNGQPDKAIRTARKAHKSAVGLQHVNSWTRTLTLLARIHADSCSDLIENQKSHAIFKRLVDIYDKHGLILSEIQHLILYAQFLQKSTRRLAAVNAFKMAKSLCLKHDLDKLAEKISSYIEQMHISEGE